MREEESYAMNVAQRSAEHQRLQEASERKVP
jgi:hypothetical protein